MAISGSIWIEGTSLHWVYGSLDYSVQGGLISASPSPTPIRGSVWVEAENVRYIDENGAYRSIGFPEGVLDRGVSAGRQGSIWIDGSSFYFLSPYSAETHKFEIPATYSASLS